jgi:hypothetical protein
LQRVSEASGPIEGEIVGADGGFVAQSEMRGFQRDISLVSDETGGSVPAAHQTRLSEFVRSP